MPYYGLATRAQAVVMKALGTPLKLITKITGISGKYIGNLVKKVVENSWNANWALLNDHLKDKPYKGRTKRITPDIKQRVINAVTYNCYGREKSSKRIGREIGISAASV